MHKLGALQVVSVLTGITHLLPTACVPKKCLCTQKPHFSISYDAHSISYDAHSCASRENLGLEPHLHADGLHAGRQVGAGGGSPEAERLLGIQAVHAQRILLCGLLACTHKGSETKSASSGAGALHLNALELQVASGGSCIAHHIDEPPVTFCLDCGMGQLDDVSAALVSVECLRAIGFGTPRRSRMSGGSDCSLPVPGSGGLCRSIKPPIPPPPPSPNAAAGAEARAKGLACCCRCPRLTLTPAPAPGCVLTVSRLAGRCR